MTRARNVSKLGNPAVFSVDTDNNVGVNSTSPVEKLNVVGVVSATSFFGDGTSLSGVGNTDYIITGTAATFSGGINAAQSDVSVRNLTGVAATFTGVVTYEDVTNVDSVGFATFRKGINVQGAGSTTTTLNVTGVSTFGGNVSIADSIIHTGDTDTAIRFPAADTFTVETAGSERLRVNSSGLVGVNTDSPGRQLTVSGKDSEGVIQITNNTSGGTGGNGFELIHFTSGETQLLNRENAAMRFDTNNTERVRIDSNGKTGININNPGSYNSAGNELVLGNTSNNGGMTIVSGTGNNGHIFFADGTGTPNRGIIKYEHAGDNMAFNTADNERLRITSTGGVHFNNAELIERVNIVGNKLSAATSVNLDNGMVHYYTTNETTTANPNIITTAGINTNMATGDTMSVTIVSKPNNAGYFPRISIDGLLTGITTYWNGGSAPSSANSSGVDVNTYQIIKTGDAAFDVLANTSNFAS
jgi:hypothetical protein